MTAGIIELAIVVFVAALLGVVARFLRQPILLAYLATGVLIASLGMLEVIGHEAFQVFSDLGIMFLLFLVGLEINYTSLRLVGKASLLLGLGQMAFTFALGFWIAVSLGFGSLEAGYLAAALTFSSTIIVVKLLSEKRDLNSLYGKLSVGVLLLQDFVAILLLVFLAGIEAGQPVSPGHVAVVAGQGIGLFILMLWLGRKILPLLFDRIARSEELLFLLSLAWVFVVAAAVSKIGFSIEIAGFLAGVALANSSEHFQIAGRIRPLRDFFILIFFVILGSSVAFSDLRGLALPIAAFSLFVLLVKPLLVMILLGLMGYRKRTGFFSGVTLAQVSEFSLVLVALGEKVGHLSSPAVSLITAAGVVTITVSSYFITHADALFRRLARPLRFFERRTSRENGPAEEDDGRSVILVGGHRTGQSIALSLPKEDLLIIDFDPEVVAELRRGGYHCLFGDIADPEIFARANVEAASLLISTSPDVNDNLALLAQLDPLPSRPKTVARAESEKDAELLYAKGADYVLLPHFTAGQYLGKTIAYDPELKVFAQLKKRDLEMLRREHFA